MANRLGMADVHAIQVLRGRGWSLRRIGRELDVHRETVARYVRLGEAGPRAGPWWPDPGDQNRPNPPAGSEDQKRPNPPAGPDGSIPGSGPASLCEPFREAITAWVAQGQSAQRIWQDLVAEHQFAGGYDSVKRFCRRLKAATPLPFRRMECAPGAEAQVDFGAGAPVITPDGRRRRTHVFRIVLSHSRSTTHRHIPPQKRSGIERGATYLLGKADLIGAGGRRQRAEPCRVPGTGPPG